MNRLPNLEFEGAKLVYKNFSGKEGMYNAAGARNFAVIIPDMETAQALTDQGYNVKYPPIREGEEPKNPTLSVNVSFKFKAPRVIIIQGGTRTLLTEDNIGTVDFADIVHVDLVLEPSAWTMGAKSGVKPYLKTAYITIEEDRFGAKYADLELNDDMPF